LLNRTSQYRVNVGIDFVGEVEAIVGGQKALPEIESLTLEGIVQDDEVDEEE